MGKYDDRYNDGEGGTQVRSIINRLNEDHPSKEKMREVVTRPDGTKVIRVTKKRRVLVSEKEKDRRGRRSFMMGMLVCFLGLIFMGVFFAVRMSMMAGEGFVEDSVAELKESWGATDIRVTGKGVDGTSFHLSSVVAEFPEGSLIQRVELSDVSGDLDALSFFYKRLICDRIEVARAEVQLNAAARNFEMPRAKGRDLWQMRRVECGDLTVKQGENLQQSPLSLRNTKAYMYYPRPEDRGSSVVVISGGVMQLGEWKSLYVNEGKFNFSPVALEEFSVSGSTDRPTDSAEANRSQMSVSGRLSHGAALAGPFTVDADNMPFADFTAGRLAQFLTARTMSVGLAKSKAYITLPTAETAVEFNGDFPLKNICLSGMPAQMMMAEHIEPAKRRYYLPTRVTRGTAVLSHDGGTLSVALPEGSVTERDIIALSAKLTVNAENELSGNIGYGLPALLTHVEYPDGYADPIFQESGDYAWLRVALSGMANAPADNSAEVDARAEEARKNRPARIPFDELDISKLAEKVGKGDSAGGKMDPFEDNAPAADKGDSKRGLDDDADPFGSKPGSDDPFALPSPF